MSVSNYNIDLYEAIEDLVDSGWLEADTPAYGIAQKVIHEGEHQLTERQIAVYRKYVTTDLSKRQIELELIRIDASTLA